MGDGFNMTVRGPERWNAALERAIPILAKAHPELDVVLQGKPLERAVALRMVIELGLMEVLNGPAGGTREADAMRLLRSADECFDRWLTLASDDVARRDDGPGRPDAPTREAVEALRSFVRDARRLLARQ